MHQTIRHLSHPQVRISPDQDIQDWSLSDVGANRVRTLARSGALVGTTVVFSSAETKARETAQPLAGALGATLQIRDLMHENERSSTGFLPPREFERVADQFFAQPGQSVRGWETANAAQERVFRELLRCLSRYRSGDILVVGHGGVGTLSFCKLSSVPISRTYDQGPGGGGCYFEFRTPDLRPTSGWRAMEELSAQH